MKFYSRRWRSGPIYVDSGGQIISLVAETTSHELKASMGRTVLRLLKPSALFVIDRGGVKTLRFGQASRTRPGLVISALVPLLYPGSSHVEASAVAGVDTVKAAGSVSSDTPASDMAEAASVASVFGEPYRVEGKTLIPVASWFRFMLTARPGSGKGGFSAVSPVALIEVEAGQVRIQAIPRPFPFTLALLVGAWDFYWILRTISRSRRR